MGKDKIDELIAEVFNGKDGPIETVSDWYGNLDASDVKLPRTEQLPDGKIVYPGHWRVCLYAGWAPGIDRICDSCPYQLRCFPSPNGQPLTDPVIVKGLTVPEDLVEYSENSENA